MYNTMGAMMDNDQYIEDLRLASPIDPERLSKPVGNCPSCVESTQSVAVCIESRVQYPDHPKILRCFRFLAFSRMKVTYYQRQFCSQEIDLCLHLDRCFKECGHIAWKGPAECKEHSLRKRPPELSEKYRKSPQNHPNA